MEARYYDIIAVGAGPAGSTAAYHLARRGYSVLIIEKEYFPRLKPCGGGLTHRCFQAFPFDISPVIENTIHQFQFTHRFSEGFTRQSVEPLVYTTMRDAFDSFLVQKAVEQGAEFIDGTKVTGFTEAFDKVVVHAGQQEFHASYIIGCDGINGITAKTFHLAGDFKRGIGIESEIKVSQTVLDEYKDRICLDWGTINRGYAFLFPKKDHLTIGVGGPIKMAHFLKPYFFDFLRSLNISDIEIVSFRTYPVPFRSSLLRVQTSRVFLTGDAAALVDPLTGEGIFFAVRSATLAAETIMKLMDGSDHDPFEYKDKIDSQLMPELKMAMPIQNIFNSSPGFFHRKLKHSDRMWRGFTRVLKGELTYIHFLERFKTWKFLWTPVILVAETIDWLKRNRYKIRKKREV